jgi:hypothetical protein
VADDEYRRASLEIWDEMAADYRLPGMCLNVLAA